MALRPLRATVRVSIALFGAVLVAMGGGTPLAAPQIALASSVTYTVNTTTDTTDADVGASSCQDAHGKCSLRAAIMQANYHPGADTIVVPQGTYKLTRVGRADDAAVVGDLDITDSVTIKGAGQTSTIVDGNGSVTGDRVFQVLPSAAAVTIIGLTIQNGRRTVDTFDDGGGIKWETTAGSLTLSHVTIRANAAKYDGGAELMAGDGATLHLDHLLVSGNSATAAGGGLVVSLGFTAFSLASSRITGNSAYEGGGMYIQGTTTDTTTQTITTTEIDGNAATLSGGLENRAGTASTPLAISDSWIHGNSASGYGGGIGTYGRLDVTNSTVSGNSAVTRGGGIYGYAGSLTHLTNATVSGNTTPGAGGAVYLEKFVSSAAAMNAIDTTFGGNVASSGGAIAGDGGTSFATWNVLMAKGATGANCALAVTVVQPTFADDASCGLGGGDNAAVELSSLGYHGGNTPTQVPLAGSAGVDAGTTLATPLVDQRGIARPQGAAHDAGSVEVCQTAPTAPVLLTPLNGSTTAQHRVTLSWSAVPCVEGYQVVVRRGSTTGTIVQSLTLTQATSLMTVTLTRGSTYDWRVEAVGDRGNANSVWRHFHVR